MKSIHCKMAAAIAVAAALAMGASAYAEDGGEPVRGGTLTVLEVLEPDTLDPLFGDQVTNDRTIYNQFYETLVRVLPDGSVEPLLAESYDIDETAGTITFHLRSGVTFHDGEPLDAAAVVANLKRLIDPEVKSPKAREFTQVKSIEAADADTVVITLAEYAPAVLSSLAHDPGLIVSPKALEQQGADYGKTDAVGTGPFTFVRWERGQFIESARNENYWRDDAKGEQLPYLDGVTTKFMIENAARVNEMRAGTADFAVQIEGRDVAPLDAEEDLVARPSPVVYVQVSQLGNINGVMKDERLRKAYSLSIDRAALAAAVLPPGEEPVIVALPITDKWWVYNSDVGGAPAYDPEQAKKLMAEAGHPDGFTMKMTIANREPDKQIAQLMQAMLAENGITMEIEIVTRDAFVERVVVTRDFDVSQGNIGTPRYDPTQVFDYFLTCNGAVSLTCDPALDEIIARAGAAADPAERKAIYDEAQAYAVEHVLLTGLFARPATGMVRTNVHGIEDDVDGPLRFGEAWKSE